MILPVSKLIIVNPLILQCDRYGLQVITNSIDLLLLFGKSTTIPKPYGPFKLIARTLPLEPRMLIVEVLPSL